jgi:DNA-binding HxlR family transcriptional regulator
VTGATRDFYYREMDPVICARPRLAILALLMTVDWADFSHLKKTIGITDGTLGVHLRRLEDAGYITIEKVFIDRKPRTRCALTERGWTAFRDYVRQLERFLEKKPDNATPGTSPTQTAKKTGREQRRPRLRPAMTGQT